MAESRQTRRGARRPVAFISHHSSQDQIARHLKGVLARHGVDGWMAPDDIEPGVPFDRAIIDQLRRSDMIILLFCARSDQSKHVKRELMLAEDQNKLVYPVRLEAIEPTGLAYWLQDYQWTDWIDRRDATIEAMVATVKRQVVAADAAALQPAREPVEPELPPPMPAPAALPLAATGSPPPESGATRKRGFGRNAWIAMGVSGALLAVLVGLGIFAMTGSGWSSRDSDRGRTASNDEDEGDGEEVQDGGEQSVVDVQFFMPGRWRTTSWINELDAPGLPDAAREQMLQQLNASRTTGEQCISPEDADNPQASFFNLDQGGSCASAEPYIADGRIELAMSCTAAGLPAPTNLSIEGSYTPTEFTLNLTMTTEVAQAGTITMRGVATGEHLGDCGQARE